MIKNLIETLLDRKLIGEGTLIKGKVIAASLGQDLHYVPMELMIVGKYANGFTCRDRLQRPYKMEFDRIETIDGMDVARFASVYNIKSDGSSKNQGKKRGRKPKSAQINTMEGESHGKDKRTENHNQAEPAGA